MNFEWDEEKNSENISKHGLDFSDAAAIFASPMLIVLDDRADYGEDRWIGIGFLNERVVVVVFTVTGKRQCVSSPCERPPAMSENASKSSSKTDWSKVDALTDEQIDLSDAPELGDEFFGRAAIRLPDGTVQVTLKLDPSLYSWFESQPGDPVVKMRAALRIYRDAHESGTGQSASSSASKKAV